MAGENNEEMMNRISELAGRINRHKNQQAELGTGRASHHRYSNGRYRGRGQPYPPRPVHRHRSLVLNGNASQAKVGDTDSASDTAGSSWVTKNDRHLQLINASVYGREAPARTRAIEQTQRQNRALRDNRERARFANHIKRMVNHGAMGPPDHQAQPSTGKYELTIQGIRFVVAKNGSKLVKVPGDANSALVTPKVAHVGGVRFCRSKNGNLYRHGIVRAHRESGAVKKVDAPCKIFSMTGSCLLGPRCRYMHDPDKVAVCKDFLQQGDCVMGEACDLSHDLTPERTPPCLHFAKDNCTKPNCRYAHVKVSPGAPVCRSFGIYGYCEKGADCPDRHAFECPDYSNTGVCRSKSCKLPHRERASALRKARTVKDEEVEDLSSDDDGESVDSNDVDSDEVDEFLGQHDTDDVDFMERNYIEL